MFAAMARAFEFWARFCVSAENIGLRDTTRVLLLDRIHGSPGDRKIFLRSLDRPFFTRGRADLGVISHFFRPGYRIVDAQGPPVRTIVDAGANIGDETIRFRFFHPNAMIIALEAEPDNFRLLKKNTANDQKT